MKICTKCKINKPLSEFYKRPNVASGFMSHCKKCNAEKVKEYRKNNVEKMRKLDRKYSDKKWKAHLKRKYGLSADRYYEILKSQNGTCAICKTIKPGGRTDKMHVDHDHKTGVIRGLLCSKCNQMLGYANDNLETLRSAIKYLSTLRSRRNL